MPTSQSATSSSPKAAKVSKAANGVADKADSKISELARRAENAAKRAETALHDGVETLRGYSHTYGEEAARRFDEAQKAVSEKVRERPITGIMAAAGVGFLLGLLVSRRH
jgi:ElaB/YqjD/DUF883 family membrane-anchored ribosome-binding protein